MRVSIEKVADVEMPYNTVADWREDLDGRLIIRYVDLGDRDFEFLLWSHELHEAILCARSGVTAQMVDEFDEQFERSRELGDDSEAGDSLKAPYHWQHCVAEAGERVLAIALGVDWAEYATAVDKAFWRVCNARK